MRIQKLRDAASRTICKPWFAYGAIFLLQLKVMWGIWQFRDLTSGDTSSYFTYAVDWYRNWHLTFEWSPLYTAFYGTLLRLLHDVYAATIAHRLITALVLSVLVLALMRCLLPPVLAWFMAAWWVLLPINFDTLYEIHLFSVIPVVVAFLVISHLPGPLGRGCAVAILVAGAFLLRNELLLPAAVFAVISIGRDLRRKARNWKRSYAIPLAVSFVAILFAYVRSSGISGGGALDDFAKHLTLLEHKHTLNICQTYAFGYQQRHEDWQGSPWTECDQLMKRVYGVPRPSLLEALHRNPGAMFEHFRWNLELIPNGMQVLLFNVMSGTVTPDYPPVPIQPTKAILRSILALLISGAGLVLLLRNRRKWWESWLKDRAWVWLAMACVAGSVVIVIFTQRPRPSYMLALGIILRAAFGMFLFAIGNKLPHLEKLAWMAPIVCVLMVLSVPSYYDQGNTKPSRPLLDVYRRLEPFAQRFQDLGAGLVISTPAYELCNYLGPQTCRPLNFRELSSEVTSRMSWSAVLDKHHATLFYADQSVSSDPMGSDFIMNAPSYGWQAVSFENAPGQIWAVFERGTSSSPLALPKIPNNEIVAPDSGIALGRGWYDLEIYPDGHFRWANNDAELIVRRLDNSRTQLLLDVEGGPSLVGKPLALEVHSGTRKLTTLIATGRQTLRVPLGNGNTTLRLHVNSANGPVPNDPRILNFRVFKASIE